MVGCSDPQTPHLLSSGLPPTAPPAHAHTGDHDNAHARETFHLYAIKQIRRCPGHRELQTSPFQNTTLQILRYGPHREPRGKTSPPQVQQQGKKRQRSTYGSGEARTDIRGSCCLIDIAFVGQISSGAAISLTAASFSPPSRQKKHLSMD